MAALFASIGGLGLGSTMSLNVLDRTRELGIMGQVFALLLKNPINLTTSAEGWLIWLLVILTIGAVASAFPAWSAARKPVNAVLAYA